MGSEGQSNIELVERGYAAWNNDDLDAMLELCHPDVRYDTSGVFPGMQEVYEGPDGMRRWWAEFHEPWKEIKVIPERIAESGDEMAILIRFEGVGRGGIETTMRFINTIEARDGKAYRFGARPYSKETARELGLD